MKISASVNVSYANEEERKRFEQLFRNSQGELKSVLTSEIFPPSVRFGPDFTINQRLPASSWDLTFIIHGVAFEK
jgi:hypothetical protein